MQNINFVGCLLYGLYYMLLLFNNIQTVKSTGLNNRPIIGLLAQEKVPGNYSYTYISAAYVKALESAGARVVPIFINKTLSYYRRIISHVNGVVIPGGQTVYGVRGGFYEAALNVYNLAKESNDAGIKLPILGVCQGMEVLAYISGQPGDKVLVACQADNLNLPLQFKPHAVESHLYKFLPDSFYEILASKPITSNHHELCLTEENMYKYNVTNDWITLSTSKDWNGLQFVSSIEHRKYPFAAVQFHPEKPAYQWHKEQKNPHDYEAIHVNRYFNDWLVNKSRLNWNRFSNGTLTEHLIDNYPITFWPDTYDTEYYIFDTSTN